jgi:DNA-binding transcriptional LysR family regulator
VPRDIVAPFVPPVLRAFSRDWPRVRLTLEIWNTVRLRQMLARDELDLCLATELGCDVGGDVLFTEPLVWVGALGGTAWQTDPLPLALGDPSCAFRVPIMEALTGWGRDWRRACECRDDAGVMAVIAADLAVGAFLRSTSRRPWRRSRARPGCRAARLQREPLRAQARRLAGRGGAGAPHPPQPRAAAGAGRAAA